MITKSYANPSPSANPTQTPTYTPQQGIKSRSVCTNPNPTQPPRPHLPTTTHQYILFTLTTIKTSTQGIKSRGVYETPGGSILRAAHMDLEGMTVDREVLRLKETLQNEFSRWVGWVGGWVERCAERGREKREGDFLACKTYDPSLDSPTRTGSATTASGSRPRWSSSSAPSTTRRSTAPGPSSSPFTR